MGEAGAGKSTSLQMYALTKGQNDDKLVIFVPLANALQNWRLSNFSESHDDRIEHLDLCIANYLSHKGISILPEQFFHELSTKQTVLLLDGIDEAIGQHPWIIKGIEYLAKKYKKHIQIIVTSRASGKYIEAISFFGVTLLPFTEQQRDSFIDKWFDEESEKDKQIKDKIKNHLKNNKSVSKAITLETREEFREKLMEQALILTEEEISKEEAQLACNELIDPCNILIPMTDNGKYGFGHLQFQEHLVAKEIAANRSIDILDLIKKQWRQGVLVFFAHMNTDIYWLINKMGECTDITVFGDTLQKMIEVRPLKEQASLRKMIETFIDNNRKNITIRNIKNHQLK